ncbi:MAG: hypothetical protein ACYCOU_02960 [Sulfobacillus sp.]
MCLTCQGQSLPPGTTYMLLCPEVVRVTEIPPGVMVLNCHGSRVSELPQLPDSLKQLLCENMPLLTRLPTLPIGLEKLTVQNCQSFHTVPPLPQRIFGGFGGICGLLQLYVINCPQVIELPPLPSTLSSLDCSGTSVTRIPELPKCLSDFACVNCPRLAALPALPVGLQVLDCRGAGNGRLELSLQKEPRLVFGAPSETVRIPFGMALPAFGIPFGIPFGAPRHQFGASFETETVRIPFGTLRQAAPRLQFGASFETETVQPAPPAFGAPFGTETVQPAPPAFGTLRQAAPPAFGAPFGTELPAAFAFGTFRQAPQLPSFQSDRAPDRT